MKTKTKGFCKVDKIVHKSKIKLRLPFTVKVIHDIRVIKIINNYDKNWEYINTFQWTNT